MLVLGKTEVSIRASFKAVCDNKQVAVLCPTTILSEQHFHTFQKRYQEFPVTVKVLNRFVSPAEQKTSTKGTRRRKDRHYYRYTSFTIQGCKV